MPLSAKKEIVVDGKKLMSVGAMVDYTGISANTLRHYIRGGTLKGKKIAGRWYAFESSLKDFLLKGE